MIHVALFGVPRVLRAGLEVALPVRKTLALVVYLSLEGRSSRARLAELFWGDLDEATARRNLRRALHRLRAAGLKDALSADDDSVGLVGVDNDLGAFQRAVNAEQLASALALRSGSFCDGLALDGADSFEQWLRGRRERFLRDWRSVVVLHARALEAGGDLRSALTACGQLLDDDPLQEATYRDLMRLHDALGERATALELFARCEQMLRDELQLEPLPETRLLAERIRAHQLPPVAGARAGAAAAAKSAPFAAGTGLVAVPFVARERELTAIAALRQAVVLIEGEAGVGKSRLALEAWRRAGGERGGVSGGVGGGVSGGVSGSEPAPVVRVRFTEMSSSTPFHSIADALRQAAVGVHTTALDLKWRRDLGRLLPELLPALLPEQPADEARSAELAATPEVARSRLLEALTQALALASGGSGIVLFDDLQWADASSMELLAHMARRHRQQPATLPRVLATARGDELADNQAASVALQAIDKDGELARLALSVFDEWSMLQLVQRLSNSEGGVRFAARLGAATGGNVFFALETIQALFESGELRVEEGEGWATRHDHTTTDYAEMPLPASVVEAVRARMTRLDAATQRVLETAALAEDGSTLAEIQGATALSDWEALEGIERAVTAQLLDRSGSGYRFAHSLIRGAIRSGLSPERQRLTHAKLAAALEPLHASPARIARHWEQAGQTAAAARAWVSAAKAAGALHAHREAIDHYGRAAALASDPAQAFEWHDLRLVHMMSWEFSADREALVSDMLALAEHCGSDALMFRALLRAAQAAAQARKHVDCERHALRALREFQPPDVRRHLAALSTAAFAASRQLGRSEDALLRWLQLLEVAERSQPKDVAWAAAAAASAAIDLDRLEQAAALRERALHALLVWPQTEPTVRAQVLSRCSLVLRAAGERTACLEENEHALSIARRLRNSLLERMYLANQCETLIDDGQDQAASATHAACVAKFGDADTPFARYLIAMIGAPLQLLRGELGAAVDAAQTAIAAADSMGEDADRRDARLLYADLLAHIGGDSEALRLADEAVAMAQLPAGRVLLPVENLRVAAELERDPDGAAGRLRAALAAPLADRLLHPHVAAARVLVGRCELAAGRADAARAAVRDVRYSVALESEAHAVRLAADALEDRADAAGLEAAMLLLDSGRLPPLHALRLMRAIAALRGKRGAAAWRERMRAVAQSLADSLRAMPPLQAGFIRKYRDLLT